MHELLYQQHVPLYNIRRCTYSMNPRAVYPIGIKVRAAHQLSVALHHIIHRQCAQAIYTEICAYKGPDNIAMHNRTLHVIIRVTPIGSRLYSGKIAQKAATESIASSGGINNLFQRIGGSTEIHAIRAKQ